MNFGALLHYAKRKVDETKGQQQQQNGKFYSTKYSPPKKVSRASKQLSNNIQEFLRKKENEEAEAEAVKRRKQNQKMDELMAKREEKKKPNNNIGQMLKVTNSANKDGGRGTGRGTGTGPGHETGEGQGDDYGYTSNEANVLYEQYLEKVQHVKENKSFAPSRPQLLRDLSGTRERVKAAIDRERQEAESLTRPRRSRSRSRSSCPSNQATNTFKRPDTPPPPVKTSSSSLSSSRSSRSRSRSSSRNRNPAGSHNIKTDTSVGSKSTAEAVKPSTSGISSQVPTPPVKPYAKANKNGTKDRPAGSGSLAKKRQYPPANNTGQKRVDKKRNRRTTATEAVAAFAN